MLEFFKSINNDYANLIMILIAIITAYIAIKAIRESYNSRVTSGLPYLIFCKSDEKMNSIYLINVDLCENQIDEVKETSITYCLKNCGNGVAAELSFERFGLTDNFKIENNRCTAKIKKNLLADSFEIDIFSVNPFANNVILPSDNMYIDFKFKYQTDELLKNSIHINGEILSLTKKVYAFEISYISLSDMQRRHYIIELCPIFTLKSNIWIPGFIIGRNFRGRASVPGHAWKIVNKTKE